MQCIPESLIYIYPYGAQLAGTYTQRRALPPVGSCYTARNNPDGSAFTPVTPIYRDMGQSQVTTSFRTGKGESLVSESELRDNNSYLNNLLQTTKVEYDTGHAFSTIKYEALQDFPVYRVHNNLGTYFTPFITQQMNISSVSQYPSIPAWTMKNSDGNQAILKTYPTAPNVALSQTIAELKREGLPSIAGTQIASMKGGAARAIGGEYLNLAFGWTPLISDLDKLLKSVVSASKTIQQMKRDSGRVVRRKYNFPAVRTLVRSDISSAQSISLPDAGSPLGTLFGELIVEEVVTTNMWFSGAYTYYLDPGDNLVGQAMMYEQLASKLLGLRLTPSTLWELTPWSWLADWYTNVGKNLAVASAFQSDGLVLKYGYLMRKVTAERIYTYTRSSGSHASPYRSQLVLKTTSKERVKSTPYGFGLNVDQFTDRQWAIVGALGLTKAPRSLR